MRVSLRAGGNGEDLVCYTSVTLNGLISLARKCDRLQRGYIQILAVIIFSPLSPVSLQGGRVI